MIIIQIEMIRVAFYRRPYERANRRTTHLVIPPLTSPRRYFVMHG